MKNRYGSGEFNHIFPVHETEVIESKGTVSIARLGGVRNLVWRRKWWIIGARCVVWELGKVIIPFRWYSFCFVFQVCSFGPIASTIVFEAKTLFCNFIHLNCMSRYESISKSSFCLCYVGPCVENPVVFPVTLSVYVPFLFQPTKNDNNISTLSEFP